MGISAENCHQTPGLYVQANDKKIRYWKIKQRDHKRGVRDGSLGRSFGCKSSIYPVC